MASKVHQAISRTKISLTTALIALGMAGVASASAVGISYWGVHKFQDIPIPSGQLTGGVYGKGLHVDSAGGNFASAGNLCNWRIDVDFYDASGTRYDSVSSGVVRSCTRAAQRKYAINRNMKEGRACIRLYTAFDDRVASVCHNIVR